MECNKDEAVRAREIAEMLFLDRDFTGAKKFALKAQTLFSELDGLSQFLEMIDVYVAHENKKNGELDYYGILGVDPFSDEEALRRQYRRKALALHPDKNKSVGADGAFKIMSEAWTVLSDKEKRSAYDLKVNIRAPNQTSSFSSPLTRYPTPAATPQHVSTRPSTPRTATRQPRSSTSHHPSSQWTPRYTPAPSHPGSSTFGTGTSTKHTAAADPQYGPPQPPVNPTPGTSSMNVPDCPRTPGTAAQCETVHVSSRNPRLVPRHRMIPSAQDFRAPRPPSYNQHRTSRNEATSSTCPFWTLCSRCRIQYEFLKIYLNRTLMCPLCRRPFLATEMRVPNAMRRE